LPPASLDRFLSVGGRSTLNKKEGAALDVREGAKKCHFLPHLKTKTDNGLDTNKQKKEEVPSRPAPMMRSTLAELHYIPEKTLSITLIRES